MGLWDFEVFEERIWFSVFKIIHVVAVGVGFALEGDIAVGLVPISELKEPEYPFEYVEDIERYEKKFFHLGIVDTLMVDDVSVNP